MFGSPMRIFTDRSRFYTHRDALYSYFDSVISTRPRPLTLRPASIRTSRTHEDDQPTNRLPHCRAFSGQPSRRSQSAQCKGEHGQHQPCNVHPPRKSTTSTRSGAIPRGKVRSSTHAPPQFDHSSHRGHARDRMQPVVLGFTSILAQCGGGCAGVRPHPRVDPHLPAPYACAGST